MAKKKEVEEELDEVVEVTVIGVVKDEKITFNVSPITETFSNGDLNVLRDKINELVQHING